MNTKTFKEAKTKFLSGDYSVEDYLKQNDFVLEYAYCRLLQGDYIQAKNEFKKIKNKDLRADWALKLIQFIEHSVIDIPSYFQLRNFLEIDLNLLIRASLPDFVDDILAGADLFYSINPESYKFISRVMTNNNFSEIALFYLLKAKDKFYYDPEMHYMLANCYIKNNDKKSAIEALNNCLCILPQYLPAKKMLSQIIET